MGQNQWSEKKKQKQKKKKPERNYWFKTDYKGNLERKERPPEIKVVVKGFKMLVAAHS